jgi:single-strand DNA-binding protein
MSQENTITLRGFVTAEPKFWQPTAKHTPTTEIRVGSTPRRLNRASGEWEDGVTSYYTVKCWRRLAVNVRSSLRKGDMVIIKGKFVTRTWTDDQQRTRTQVQVEADSVGHDLAFGWSLFNRGTQGWNLAQAQADGEVARQDLEASPHGPDDADEFDAMRDSDMADADMADAGIGDAGMGEPGTAESGMPEAGMPEPGLADSGVPDPEMSDADFEKLAAGLDAQAEIAPTY